MKRIVLIVTLGIGLLAAPVLFAQSADCAGCHSEGNPPVGAEALEGSAHGALACTDCHIQAEGEAHPKDLQPVDCGRCHDTEKAAWESNPHATAEGGAGCVACHGSHRVLPMNDPDGIRSPSVQIQVCGDCHKHGKLRDNVSGEQWIMDYEGSAHGLAVLEKGLQVAPSCSDCHGGHGAHNLRTEGDAEAKLRVAAICGGCHQSIHRAFLTSIHAAALEEGLSSSPTCIDCHGEHTIQGPGEEGSSVAPATVPSTCGKCHEDKEIMANFGIPTNRVSTFLDSYHGIALEMGDVRAANCASCHGAHDILPSSNPSSRTAAGNLDSTCGKCHPNAGEGFATMKFHEEVSPEGARGAWFVRVFYIAFIGLLILAFLLHICAETFSRLRGRVPR